ncbi:phosphoenolpyruvate phosphomutase, putative [Campylobacter iguaniorum]|uniref:phosphoenolpyruvate mutase n=1 Tax=Campylobacter iguaniorum TaxID=1244531 RepID=UPI00073A30F3|nr:phosphoenolpyruvate mutase [Campylobacter iguaniorum]ALV25252.1 phosphoenolpyruvate phosphomutase, putative [Campylobacter iguaniorum]
MKKLVYVPMAADIIHPGHLNIIKEAAKLGHVMVGLFSDRAIASYKRVPFMTYEKRKIIVENLKGVDEVVMQDEKEYEPNLIKYKPSFLVHGSDWNEGPLNKPRQRAIELMNTWGGKVVEPEYTKDVSSTKFNKKIKEIGIMPHIRLASLKKALNSKPMVKGIEAHNGLSAMIVEDASAKDENGVNQNFDLIWLSSLTDSSAKGKPDIEFVDLTSRMATVNDILEVCTKPIIYDGDTGSEIPHFALTVKRLERLGVSAVVIEDKIGLKKNSLLEGVAAKHTQDDIEHFCDKIKAGKNSQITDDFMIIARIESLILGAGMDDAISRAKAYIKAGADGIMIHSRKKDGAEILKFCEIYNKFEDRKPLMVVPTNYPTLSEADLQKAGANIIVYANQLLRASYTAMLNTATSILFHKRALEADKNYISALDLIGLIKGN